MQYTRPHAMRTKQEWREKETELHGGLAEYVDAILEQRFQITPEDPVYVRVKEDFLQNLVKMSEDYSRVKRLRMWGADTRHGSHVREKKMRRGVRYYDHGETVIRWYVCDVPVGWLTDLRRDADVRFDVDNYRFMRGQRINEYVGEKIADVVFAQHGERPYASGTGVSHSPSGRWFSNVIAHQVGTRLLVTHSAQIDV